MSDDDVEAIELRVKTVSECVEKLGKVNKLSIMRLVSFLAEGICDECHRKSIDDMSETCKGAALAVQLLLAAADIKVAIIRAKTETKARETDKEAN